MDFNNKWFRWIVGLAIFGYLLAMPFTRRIILFLLPLGSGFDDLIEIVIIIVLLGVLLARGYLQFDLGGFVSGLNVSARLRDIFLFAVATGALFLIPFTSEKLWSLILYGTAITDPTFFVVLAIDFAVVILGWLFLSWRFK